jgi:hypothetical protein
MRMVWAHACLCVCVCVGGWGGAALQLSTLHLLHLMCAQTACALVQECRIDRGCKSVKLEQHAIDEAGADGGGVESLRCVSELGPIHVLGEELAVTWAVLRPVREVPVSMSE